MTITRIIHYLTSPSVPRADPAGRAIVLSGSELSRLKHDSRVLTKEERLALEEIAKQEKRQAEQAAEARRQRIKQYDLARRESEKLTDLEEEARERAEHLLQKAMEQRAEQEDEIKRLNEVSIIPALRGSKNPNQVGWQPRLACFLAFALCILRVANYFVQGMRWVRF